MHALVTGATGFVGSALVPALEAGGATVRAGTRRPEEYSGAGTPVLVDLDDPATFEPALAGCDVAYFLVHWLGQDDLVDREERGARRFAEVAASAGVRVVFLGGLGTDGSAHLTARHRVGEALQKGCDAVVLRAGVVIGPGGISFEMIRQLVSRLPVIALPRAALTSTEAVALADVITYLVAAAELPAGSYDIGCGEPTSFADLVRRVAAGMGRNPVVSASVPLAAEWFAVGVPFVTDQWARVARQLFESMDTESVAEDHRLDDLLGHEPLSLDRAIASALAA